MAHPLATRAIATARVKNDAVDAHTLAHLLRTRLLPEAWIAPLEVREARRLVRMRAGLVRIRSRLKCQIHALLAEAGVSVSKTYYSQDASLGGGGSRGGDPSVVEARGLDANGFPEWLEVQWDTTEGRLRQTYRPSGPSASGR